MGIVTGIVGGGSVFGTGRGSPGSGIAGVSAQHRAVAIRIILVAFLVEFHTVDLGANSTQDAFGGNWDNRSGIVVKIVGLGSEHSGTTQGLLGLGQCQPQMCTGSVGVELGSISFPGCSCPILLGLREKLPIFISINIGSKLFLDTLSDVIETLFLGCQVCPVIFIVDRLLVSY